VVGPGNLPTLAGREGSGPLTSHPAPLVGRPVRDEYEIDEVNADVVATHVIQTLDEAFGGTK